MGLITEFLRNVFGEIPKLSDEAQQAIGLLEKEVDNYLLEIAIQKVLGTKSIHDEKSKAFSKPFGYILPNTKDMTFNQELKTRRRALAITLRVLSDYCGVAISTLSLIEKGELKSVKMTTEKKIREALDYFESL